MDTRIRSRVRHAGWVLTRLLLNWIIVAVAVWAAVALVPDITVSHNSVFTYLWLAVLFGLVNAILGPILHLLALPLTILTLGLFALDRQYGPACDHGVDELEVVHQRILGGLLRCADHLDRDCRAAPDPGSEARNA